jgi:hypothetical protein
MKKVMKKAQQGSKVKTVERGTLPNVDVKSNPIFNLDYKPSKKDLEIVRPKSRIKMDSTSKMKMGGALKPVDKSKKPGLAKLPTAVRNKMGFQKNGGKMSKKK